jgi:hypothetical protein
MRLIIPEGWQPSGGEWRHLLTPRQIAEMNTLLGAHLWSNGVIQCDGQNFALYSWNPVEYNSNW